MTSAGPPLQPHTNADRGRHSSHAAWLGHDAFSDNQDWLIRRLRRVRGFLRHARPVGTYVNQKWASLDNFVIDREMCGKAA